MKRMLTGLLRMAVVSMVALSTSCVEDVLRLDVVLQVTRAASLANVDVQYEYRTDVDTDNVDGSGRPQVDGFVIAEGASTIQFEVFGSSGFGRSPTVQLADVPADSTLTVPILLAPKNDVRLVSDAPVDLGGDACVASDENGILFMMGGSRANQLGYIYDNQFAIRSIGSSGPARNPGCAAFNGRVAVVGGCTGTPPAVISLVDVDGSVSTISLTDTNVADEALCGAVAAPQARNGALFISKTGAVFQLAEGGAATFVENIPTLATAIEVMTDGAAVALAGGSAFYIAGDSIIDLGPAQALGRRFDDVLVLDGDEIKRVTGPATERERILVGVGDAFSSFAVTSDGAFVGIAGSNVIIVDSDQKKTTLPMGRPHKRVIGLPGDTILLAGGDEAGFDGFSRR